MRRIMRRESPPSIDISRVQERAVDAMSGIEVSIREVDRLLANIDKTDESIKDRIQQIIFLREQIDIYLAERPKNKEDEKQRKNALKMLKRIQVALDDIESYYQANEYVRLYAGHIKEHDPIVERQDFEKELEEDVYQLEKEEILTEYRKEIDEIKILVRMDADSMIPHVRKSQKKIDDAERKILSGDLGDLIEVARKRSKEEMNSLLVLRTVDGVRFMSLKKSFHDRIKEFIGVVTRCIRVEDYPEFGLSKDEIVSYDVLEDEVGGFIRESVAEKIVEIVVSKTPQSYGAIGKNSLYKYIQKIDISEVNVTENSIDIKGGIFGTADQTEEFFVEETSHAIRSMLSEDVVKSLGTILGDRRINMNFSIVRFFPRKKRKRTTTETLYDVGLSTYGTVPDPENFGREKVPIIEYYINRINKISSANERRSRVHN